jgi:excisionase family DNA binding protein
MTNRAISVTIIGERPEGIVPKPKPQPVSPVPDKLAYTIPEAAAKLSTNEWVIRRWIHDNKLKVLDASGRAYLIPHTALVEFIEKNSRNYDAPV